MEGSLATMSLVDVLELVHTSRKSGVLYVEERVPLVLRFMRGEVVGGGILDWEGFEAVSTFPLHPQEGRFRFEQGVQDGAVWMPFRTFLGEWARLNDEWARFRQLVPSPSRVLEALRPVEPYAVFVGGRSVRGAAKAWGVPLIIAMERAWRGVHEGDLVLLQKYNWFSMRIRHAKGRRTLPNAQDARDLPRYLDGTRNLGELIRMGFSVEEVRAYLIEAIRSGELNFPGRGWLLRDLTWEAEAP
ncbi:DUF4388 domain-containing protein [Marinithermus hydrothermalis]|uniref:PatA-like N-terminal domain-containing protein n=1 Tax=Marinithermus hydrothermalis (strain DSM 14884 / JCM 11576 / T1) TaxID=869210 RepID=F2NLY3_MARHT|nr:DUF4388 domain-containing protein [Marinithermus hydrothermalis]AEB11240.1 hypothetical protein Marky_0488 [Marinithermus hydrothermalis DSM 14884]